MFSCMYVACLVACFAAHSSVKQVEVSECNSLGAALPAHAARFSVERRTKACFYPVYQLAVLPAEVKQRVAPHLDALRYAHKDCRVIHAMHKS